MTAFASLESVARMTSSIPHPYPQGEAERFILTARAANAAGHAVIMAITLKNKARTVIGLVSAQATDNHEIEIGYVVAPAQAGRGLATEAVTTLVDAVFNMTEARTIIGNCRAINPASRRVLEKMRLRGRSDRACRTCRRAAASIRVTSSSWIASRGRDGEPSRRFRR